VLPWKIRWKELILPKFIRKIILPLSIILFITVLGMGAYNKQITGDVKNSPYFLYERTYQRVPFFVWQPYNPQVKFNNETMEIHEERFFEKFYFEKKTLKGFFKDMQKASMNLTMFFFGYPLAIPSLAVLLSLFFNRKALAHLGGAFFILLGYVAVLNFLVLTHYFSPLTCLAVLLITIGLRGVGGLKLRNGRIGRALVIFLIVLQLFLNITMTPKLPKVMSLARNIQSSSVIPAKGPHTGHSQLFAGIFNRINFPASFTREELKNILMKQGGKYLVIVKYPITHTTDFEWVYNDADIDHAPIVWARDMDELHKKRLLEYFKYRQVLNIMVFWDMKNVPNFKARQ